MIKVENPVCTSVWPFVQASLQPFAKRKRENSALLRQAGNGALAKSTGHWRRRHSKCSAAAFEYNARCSESAVYGGARQGSFGVRAWHWQLAAQQEGAGENRGRLLETPAKKKRYLKKRLLETPAKRRAKKKHRGREGRPHPSEERARAGKDSAVAPKHGLSWTPIGKGGNDMRQ